MNICKAINCPFANLNPTPPKSSGCERYSTSYHCHLKQIFGTLTANEYWLYDPHMPDEVIAVVKQTNDEYIAQDESSQFRLERMRDD